MIQRLKMALRFAQVVLCGVVLSAQAADRIEHLQKHAPEIPNSELVKFWIDDFPIVGAELGNLKGQPVLVIGGYTTTFPYLKPLLQELERQNFHVFVYNPPGQGNGELASWTEAPENWQGIDGMLRVLPKIRQLIFDQTSQPLIIVGHSLGGLQARLGSAGIEFNRRHQPQISDEALQVAKLQTRLIVPVLSLPLRGPNVWKAATFLRILRMTKIAPFVASCISKLNCAKPELAKRMDGHTLALYLRAFQNTLSRGIFGVEDLDVRELDAVARYLLPQRVSQQILSDLLRWISTHKIDTINGLDLGAAFSKSRLDKNSTPIFYVVGEKDTLTPAEPIIDESSLDSNSSILRLPIGHMGISVSRSAAKIIVNGIRQRIEESCDQTLQIRRSS